MLVSKDGTAIMRIDRRVAIIPPFWVDVPTSSESVRLCSELSGTEPDDKVELGKELAPASLSTSKNLRGGEIFQILVVRDNVDRERSTFKVMSPDTEGLEDGQKFLVMSVIVSLGGVKGAGVESNRVDFTVFRDHGENGHESIVGGISFDNELGVRDPVGENRSGSEGLLQCLERFP